MVPASVATLWTNYLVQKKKIKAHARSENVWFEKSGYVHAYYADNEIYKTRTCAYTSVLVATEIYKVYKCVILK